MSDAYKAQPGNFAVTAAAFEGGIAILAVGMGWLFGQRPLASFSWGWIDAAWGCAATVPLFGLLWFCLTCRWKAFQRIFNLIDEVFVPLMGRCSILEYAVIALLAGLGEEMLFRGVIQSVVTGLVGGNLGIYAGLAAAAVLFGLAHSITLTYMLLAALIGAYLGVIWLLTGNLLVPIIAHAAYDFAALIYLMKIKPRCRAGC
jgi:uncharacterized protein